MQMIDSVLDSGDAQRCMPTMSRDTIPSMSGTRCFKIGESDDVANTKDVAKHLGGVTLVSVAFFDE